MKKFLQISITGNSDASLAEMMQAYLMFYLKGKYSIQVTPIINRIPHPLAIQVMLEDGVDISIPSIFKSSQLSTIEITYNNTPLNPITFIFSDPFTSSSYNTILENFRIAREEVKKASIEIAGKILQEV
ncbi:MAG: hypothetical protein ACKVPJ_04030 [Chitinophagales bacterium]